MWCPKPKAKIISRPKPIFKQQRGWITPESDPNSNSEDQRKEEQYDPHRDRRHYGMKHTDVTRMFLVEDRTCKVPCDQPYGLKKTDITRYLERIVPSHAFQMVSTNNGKRQTTPRNHKTDPHNTNQTQPPPCKRETPGDSRGAYPARPPSRCEIRESRSKREAFTTSLRPETAPTGEMKRLSAPNASIGTLLNKPATAAFSRRAITSSPLKPIDEARIAPPFKHGSKPGTAETTLEPEEEMHGSECGVKYSNVECVPGPGSRSMTASSHTSGSRLQPVPE